MSRKLAVHFEQAVEIHRARNFAEDIDRELRRTEFGTAVNPDTLTTVFLVEVSASRHIGEVKRIIHSVAGRHNLREQITVAQEK